MQADADTPRGRRVLSKGRMDRFRDCHRLPIGAKETGYASWRRHPRGRRVLSKGRMEGFSDGVFGFAITLLVVDIALHPPGTPLQQALHAWPAYLAYVTSFLTIGGAWLLHTGSRS
jgi:hypothetical protein